MQWTRPDFQEITLGMEVTAYVNTDEPLVGGQPVVRKEAVAAPSSTSTNERQPLATEN